jgi:aryl-alcohol dehydrogenase-like predicted oxidoreductase
VGVRKRALGKTGLYVSEMAVGTWGLSGDGYGSVDAEVAENTVRRALELGITLFETSDAYGAGESEALLGRALPKDAVVVTKGGTDRSTLPARKRFDSVFLRASVMRSLKRLRREKIDVYLMHNPSIACLDAGEAPATLEKLKVEGRISHWGVASGDAEVAFAAIAQGASVVELAYNLFHSVDLNRIAGEIMVNGVGVLARSVLGYGLFSDIWTKGRVFEDGDHRADRWTHDDLERRIDQLETVRYLVHDDVKSLRGAAVRFALSNTLVSSAVLGPKNPNQLEELVRETGSGPIYLPDDDLAVLPRKLIRAGILV